MFQAISKVIQGRRGHGFIDVPLPRTVKPASMLIGASSVLPPTATATVRNSVVGPKYQSATNSCLGMSAAQAYRLSALKRGFDCPDLSGLFPYKLGRAFLGAEDVDSGMSFEAVTQAIERFGLCSEASWQFSLMRVNSRPSGTALHDAYDRRGLRGYYSIAKDDVAGVRSAIRHGFAVLGAWAVNRAFEFDAGDSLISTPDGDIAGNHSMAVESYYSDGTFGLLNHYGDTWRDGGRCRFTETYMRQSMGYIVFDVGESP